MNYTTQQKWGTLLTCSLSCFLASLDFTIVNTALPAIKTDLSTSLIQLQWVVNALIFAMTVLIVTLGRISDHVGHKKINIFGVFCFGLFSLLAGLANSPEWLIICRFMQGVACAAIVPTSLALISHAFSGNEKGKAIGIWSGVTGFGMALGPVLGGIFVSALSWRWIFYINIPFSILSILFSLIYSKESHDGRNTLQPDYKGVSLFTLGLGSLVFSLMYGPDWGWTSPLTLFLFAASLIVLFFFYYFEKRSTSPTIPFELLANRAFFCSSLVMFCLVFVFDAALFLIPLYLIQVRGQAAYEAGLTILPMTAVIALLSPLMGHLMSKVSAKKLVIFGLLIFLASTVLQAFISPEISLSYLLLAFVCLGIGWGISRTPATATALAAAPSHFAGTASGTLWTIQYMGGALSIAIVITLFRKISGDSFLAGYHAAMWLLSATTLTVIIILISRMKSQE